MNSRAIFEGQGVCARVRFDLAFVIKHQFGTEKCLLILSYSWMYPEHIFIVVQNYKSWPTILKHHYIVPSTNAYIIRWPQPPCHAMLSQHPLHQTDSFRFSLWSAIPSYLLNYKPLGSQPVDLCKCYLTFIWITFNFSEVHHYLLHLKLAAQILSVSQISSGQWTADFLFSKPLLKLQQCLPATAGSLSPPPK